MGLLQPRSLHRANNTTTTASAEIMPVIVKISNVMIGSLAEVEYEY